ncbi:MAG: trypsin-like peptidase domain-containing protein [Tepidisphaeraceae bacterium]
MKTLSIAKILLLGIALSASSVAKDGPGVAGAETASLRNTVTVGVVRKVKDAVVNISATKTVAQRVSPFGVDPFWQQFDTGQVVKMPADSLGSGFIIHPDGYVVTNHHVIDRARKVNVELADGRKLPADLVSSDPDADLALLKITSDKAFPVIELGDSSDLMIGEPVIAVGNSLGYNHTVSTGIVSAVHRDLRTNENKTVMGDLVQTDAAINPGNSGGPLLNAYGQVIGINTAIRGDAQNIGFAIPVNRLRDLIPELMNPRQVRRLDIPMKLFERRKLSPPANIEVSVHYDTSTAARIVSINGKAVANLVDAYAIMLKATTTTTEIVLGLADGSEKRYPVKAAAQPQTVVDARRILGIAVEQVTPMMAEKSQLSSEDGLLVREVLKDSVAAKAGIRAGDVIIQLGRYRVGTLDDFGTIMQHLPEKGRVRVGVIRGDRVGFTAIEL